MIANEQKPVEVTKTHRRRGGAFDAFARVFKEVGEFVFRSGIIFRNRPGSIASSSYSPSDSVLEIYNKNKSLVGKFNIFFMGREGTGTKYNTNYFEINSDIKSSDAQDTANGQLRLNITRDGVLLNAGVIISSGKALSSNVDAVRTFINGEGSSSSVGGVQIGYYNENGTLIKYLVIDKDGIQLSTLPTSDPGVTGALYTSTVDSVPNVVRISG